MKKRKFPIVSVILILAILTFFVFYNYDYDSVNPTKYSENLTIPSKNVILSFYDENYNCPLNGELSIGDLFAGEVINGSYIMNKSFYDLSLNKIIILEGNTSFCFDDDSYLPFYVIWNASDIFDYDSYELDSELNPRWPSYYQEMQGFVRPYEVKGYLESNLVKYFGSDIEKNLDRINGFKMWYRSDADLFGTPEYWQTPAEVIKGKNGDCEDWAVTTLSLMKAYNSSLECYNALWDSHLSVVCFIGNLIIFYDQGDTKFESNINFKGLTNQEKKSKIRRVIDNYLDWYGIPVGETNIHALFNDKDLITFNDSEDFINWIVNR